MAAYTGDMAKIGEKFTPQNYPQGFVSSSDFGEMPGFRRTDQSATNQGYKYDVGLYDAPSDAAPGAGGGGDAAAGAGGGGGGGGAAPGTAPTQPELPGTPGLMEARGLEDPTAMGWTATTPNSLLRPGLGNRILADAFGGLMESRRAY